MLALLSAIFVAACTSPATDAAFEGSQLRPVPSQVGSLTIRPDTGAFVVGRHLRVIISGSDASGLPIDTGPAEITSSNTSVAQLISAVAIPITNPPNVYILSATFDLSSAGSTAIRARLGILVDSIVISVIPPT
jgi:hypothetical protein